MPTWRSPELEAIFGGPVDAVALSEATLERLVADRVREGEQLDFKTGVYPKTQDRNATWTNAQEFAADVAAFANHRGGVLVLGVEEIRGEASGLAPLTSSSPELEERRLRRHLVRYQAPIADISMRSVKGTESGQWYLLVIVPPSRRRPHAVVSDRHGGLHYPVRHGADKQWLTESEVADRYRDRHTAAAEEAARVDAVVRAGIEALSDSVGVWLYASTVPEVVTQGSLDRDTLAEIDAWQARHPSTSPLARSLSALGPGEAAPGRVIFTERRGPLDSPEPPHWAAVELYLDGSAFVTTAVATRSFGKPDERRVGYMTLVDDAIIAVDHCLQWTAHQAGWGTATVVLGLHDADSTFAGEVAAPIALYAGDSETPRQMTGTRPARTAPRATTVADLAFVDTVQRRLAVTHTALGRLLNWFAVAEPRELRRDGSISLHDWGHDYRRAEQWARANGVSTRPPQ